jgi:Diacylglycerol acyltransferase
MKHFLQYALEYGYTIVPVYCFGEVDTYWNLQV